MHFDKAKNIEFDELETFEHTKCKPLSVPIVVESKTRRILSFDVVPMPAKGPLAEIARGKYGLRSDGRREGRKFVFNTSAFLVAEDAVVKMDKNPFYKSEILRELSLKLRIETYKGRKSAATGQGELKKIKFDPLFSINHTCAMMRANINRLFRKTWCTTKKLESLFLHIAIYAYFHNQRLVGETQFAFCI
jgi:hypothetical protein